MLLWMIIDKKIFKPLFSQPSACMPSYLLLRAIHYALRPRDQPSVARLQLQVKTQLFLLYPVFIVLNRFRFAILYVFMIVSSNFFIFHMHVRFLTFCATDVHIAHNSVACTSVAYF